MSATKPPHKYTPRELDVAHQMDKGKDRKGIAKALKLPQKTVDGIIKSLRHKTKHDNRHKILDAIQRSGEFRRVPK